MAAKTVVARLDGDGTRVVATTGSGHAVVMDAAAGDCYPQPTELLLVAQAGCAAIDVVSILRKRQQAFTRYEVRVVGDQRDNPYPHVYERIHVVHRVEGPVDVDAVRRAIELSATKFCAVTANLATGAAEVHHSYAIRDADGDEHYGEVVVTGPYARTDKRGLPARVVAQR